MPILKQAAAGDVLRQGDLLEGLPHFVAYESGPCDETGLSLALSRDCASLHKATILVAQVCPLQLELDNFNGSSRPFDACRRFFDDELRRGFSSPDRFYLGELPGKPDKRFTAKLDSIHTVSRALVGDLAQSRVARLTPSFRRDLQVRLAQCFSRTGFEDYAWYSTSDLKYLVATGQGQRADLERDLADSEIQLGREKALGDGANKNKVKNFERIIAKISSDLESLKQELEPYERELRARSDQG